MKPIAALGVTDRYGWLLMLALLPALGLGGCASSGGYESRPWPPRPETSQPATPSAPWPPVSERGTEAPRPAPAPPPAPAPAPAPSPAPVLLPPARPVPAEPAFPSVREGRLLVARLLPAGIKDRDAWAGDIYTAFAALRLPPDADKLCAAIAVIEQESTFTVDPQVPGLSRIVRKELETRRQRYGIPKVVLEGALLLPSGNGRSYSERIDGLRTEKQMSQLFDDIVNEVPLGRQLLGQYNPVRTGGPMQVSVQFAEEQVRRRDYPYGSAGDVRREVFTRRGGLYFGIANLLDYPVDYPSQLYRFADFNAGRYSSRNAAFQQAVGHIARRKLSLDGDLLRYAGGTPDTSSPSETQRALATVDGLRMSEGEILRDLKLEKSESFGESRLYRRVFSLADALASAPAPRAVLPQIDLKSPKITRRLTTEWFARRVQGRHDTCMNRTAS